MNVGDRFVRIKSSQGLPNDYTLKPHHMKGYTGTVAKLGRYGIIDTAGHKHGYLNIEARDETEEA